MKIKKTISKLNNELENLTENEAKERFRKIIADFESKRECGSKNELEAFNNAIYTPSLSLENPKEKKLKLLLRRKNSPRAELAYSFVNEIQIARKEGKSHPQITKELNDKIARHYSHKTKDKCYFNRQYIFRFCKDYNIK